MFGRTAIALSSAAGLAAGTLLVAGPLVLPVPPAHASYAGAPVDATQTPGQFLDSVFWFDLSTLASGQTVTNADKPTDKFGKLIAVGDSYTYTEADGLPAGYEITVTASAGQLGDYTYSPGEITHMATRPMDTWSGATSYTYYNTGEEQPAVGNVLAGSTLPTDPSQRPVLWADQTTVPADAYTATDLHTITFTMEATYAGNPIPLTAVVTDAESTSGEAPRTEELFVSTDATAQWQLMELLTAPGSTTSAPRLTVHNPGTVYPDSGGWATNRIGNFDTQDSLASYLAAAANVTEVTGEIRLSSPDGAQAFALGAAVAVDTGDAPATYGSATHLVPLVPGGLAADPAIYPSLGAPAELNRGGLTGETDPEEDLSPALFGPVFQHGSLGSYTVTIPATGESAAVAGWIDANADGTFSDAEKATATVSDGAATLTWAIPDPIPATATVLQARIRTATQAEDIATPTGPARDGEVEDLLIPVIAPVNQTSKRMQIQAQSVPLTAMFPAAPATATYSFDPGKPATQKIVPGEGTYTIVGTALLFDPEPAFAGTVRTPPTVYIHTAQGATGAATYTPTVTAVAQAAPIIATAPGQDQPTQFDVSDQVHAGETLGVANTETSQGRWVVGEDNTITFYPTEGFGGVAANTYTITDANDATRTGQISVIYPDVEPISAQIAGVTTVLPTRVTSGDPSTVRLVDAAGTLQSYIVTDEGNWQVTDDGATITFTAAVGFSGVPAPIRYTVGIDAHSATATPATVTITEQPVAPVVTSVFVTGAPGVEITLTPQGNTIDPESTVFAAQGQPRGTTRSADGMTLTVAGEGTWQVREGGTFVFTPQPGFLGDPTPVLYTGTRDGVSAQPARLDISYLTDTVTDSADTRLTSITTVDVLGQVQHAEASALFTRFGQIVPAVEYFLVDAAGQREADTTVIIEQVGTYTIDPVTGTLTFTPAPGFIGIPPAMTLGATIDATEVTGARYQPVVTDNGSTRPGAIQTVIIRPVATVGGENELQRSTDQDSSDNGLPAAQIFTGAGLTGATYWIDQPGRTEFLAEGEGVYTVDTTTGIVTFLPNPGYTGTGEGVTLGVTTQAGGVYTTHYLPTVLPIEPPELPPVQRRPVPLTTVAMRGQVQYSTDTSVGDNGLNPDEAFPAADLTGATFWLREPGTTYVDTGAEGTYRVSPSGVVIYLPAADFVGIATPLTVGVTTADGQTFRTSYTPMVMPTGVYEPTPTTTTPPPPPASNGSADPAIVAPIAIASAVLGGLLTWAVITGLTPQPREAPTVIVNDPATQPQRVLAVTGPTALEQITAAAMLLLVTGGAILRRRLDKDDLGSLGELDEVRR
ncbi:MAG: CshA/CshB family fibrillar adhesin-related protein [Corynebacterium sp.]|nr:CshA/CshB family fibrillar adhesin-related protein [Corynebacterium sp.]